MNIQRFVLVTGFLGSLVTATLGLTSVPETEEAQGRPGATDTDVKSTRGTGPEAPQGPGQTINRASTIMEGLRGCERLGWAETEPTIGGHAVSYRSRQDQSLRFKLSLAGVQFEYRTTYENDRPDIPPCDLPLDTESGDWQRSVRLRSGFRLTAVDDSSGVSSATGYMRLKDRIFEVVVLQSHTEYSEPEDVLQRESGPHCPCTETRRVYYSGTIPERQVSGQITRWMNDVRRSDTLDASGQIPFKIPFLEIIRPNGGEVLQTGTRYSTRWRVNDDYIIGYGNKVSLCLAGYDSDGDPVASKAQEQSGDCAYFSLDVPESFILLDFVELRIGTFEWKVADDIESRFQQRPSKYRLYLVVLDHHPPPEPAEGRPGGDWGGLIAWDKSDGFFAIVERQEE